MVPLLRRGKMPSQIDPLTRLSAQLGTDYLVRRSETDNERVYITELHSGITGTARVGASPHENPAGQAFQLYPESGKTPITYSPYLYANYDKLSGRTGFSLSPSSKRLAENIQIAFDRVRKNPEKSFESVLWGLSSKESEELSIYPSAREPRNVYGASTQMQGSAIRVVMTASGQSTIGAEQKVQIESDLRDMYLRGSGNLYNADTDYESDVSWNSLRNAGMVYNEKGYIYAAGRRVVGSTDPNDPIQQVILPNTPDKFVKAPRLESGSDRATPFYWDQGTLQKMRGQPTTGTSRPAYARATIHFPGDAPDEFREYEREAFLFAPTQIPGGSFAYNKVYDPGASFMGQETTVPFKIKTESLEDLATGAVKINEKNVYQRELRAGRSHFLGTINMGGEEEPILLPSSASSRVLTPPVLEIPERWDPVTQKAVRSPDEGETTEEVARRIQAQQGMIVRRTNATSVNLRYGAVVESAVEAKGLGSKWGTTLLGISQKLQSPTLKGTGLDLNVGTVAWEMKSDALATWGLPASMSPDQLQKYVNKWARVEGTSAARKTARWFGKEYGGRGDVHFENVAAKYQEFSGGEFQGDTMELLNQMYKNVILSPNLETSGGRKSNLYNLRTFRHGLVETPEFSLHNWHPSNVEAIRNAFERDLALNEPTLSPSDVEQRWQHRYPKMELQDSGMINVTQRGPKTAVYGEALFHQRMGWAANPTSNPIFQEAVTNNFPEFARAIRQDVAQMPRGTPSQRALTSGLAFLSHQTEMVLNKENPQMPTNYREMDDELQASLRTSLAASKGEKASTRIQQVSEIMGDDELYMFPGSRTMLPNPRMATDLSFKQFGVDAAAMQGSYLKSLESALEVNRPEKLNMSPDMLVGYGHEAVQPLYNRIRSMLTSGGESMKHIQARTIEAGLAGRYEFHPAIGAGEGMPSQDQAVAMLNRMGFRDAELGRSLAEFNKGGFFLALARHPESDSNAIASLESVGVGEFARRVGASAAENIFSDIRGRGILNTGLAISTAFAGDYDRDLYVAAVAAQRMQTEGEDGEIINMFARVDDSELRAKQATNEWALERERQVFPNYTARESFNALVKSTRDVNEDLNVVKKAVDKRKGYGIDKLWDAGVGFRYSKTPEMGIAFNLGRGTDPVMATLGYSDPEILRTRMATIQGYNNALDNQLEKVHGLAIGGRASAMVSNAAFRWDEGRGEGYFQVTTNDISKRANRTITITDPATGQERQEVLPGYRRWNQRLYTSDVNKSNVFDFANVIAQKLMDPQKTKYGEITATPDELGVLLAGPGDQERLAEMFRGAEEKNRPQVYQNYLRELMEGEGGIERAMGTPIFAQALTSATVKAQQNLDPVTGKETFEGTHRAFSGFVGRMPNFMAKIGGAAAMYSFSKRMGGATMGGFSASQITLAHAVSQGKVRTGIETLSRRLNIPLSTEEYQDTSSPIANNRPAGMDSTLSAEEDAVSARAGEILGGSDVEDYSDLLGGGAAGGGNRGGGGNTTTAAASPTQPGGGGGGGNQGGGNQGGYNGPRRYRTPRENTRLVREGYAAVSRFLPDIRGIFSGLQQDLGIDIANPRPLPEAFAEQMAMDPAGTLARVSRHGRALYRLGAVDTKYRRAVAALPFSSKSTDKEYNELLLGNMEVATQLPELGIIARTIQATETGLNPYALGMVQGMPRESGFGDVMRGIQDAGLSDRWAIRSNDLGEKAGQLFEQVPGAKSMINRAMRLTASGMIPKSNREDVVPQSVIQMAQLGQAIKAADPELLKETKTSKGVFLSGLEDELRSLSEVYKKQKDAVNELKAAEGDRRKVLLDLKSDYDKEILSKSSNLKLIGTEAMAEEYRSRLESGKYSPEDIGKWMKAEDQAGKLRAMSATQQSEEEAGPFGRAARRLLGGFGLMYLQSIGGFATSGLGYGQSERTAQDQLAGQTAYRQFGVASIPYNQQQALQNKMAMSGVNVNPITSIQEILAENPGVRDIVTGATSFTGAWAYSQWAASTMPDSKLGKFLGKNSVGIGIAASGIATGADVWARMQDPYGTGRRVGSSIGPGGGLPGINDILAKDAMFLFDRESWNQSMQAEFGAIAARTVFDQGGSIRDLQNQKLLDKYNVFPGRAPINIGKGGQQYVQFGQAFSTTEQNQLISDKIKSAIPSISPEAANQTAGFLQLYYPEMPTAYQTGADGKPILNPDIQALAADYQQGGRAATLSQQILQSAGVAPSQMYAKGGKYPQLQLELVKRQQQGELDEGTIARIQGGAEYLASIPGSRYISQLSNLRNRGTTKEEIDDALKLYEKAYDLQGTPAGSAYEAQQAAYAMSLRTGRGGVAEPDVFSFSPNMSPELAGRMESQANALYSTQQSSLNRAQGFMNQEYGFGRQELGDKLYDFMLKTPSGQGWMYDRVFNMDPMAMAALSQKGLNLSGMPGMRTLGGQSIGAEYAAFTDTMLGSGSLTGMPWGSTSFNLGNVSAGTMAERLFGSNWQGNSKFSQAMINAGVNGQSLGGSITLPTGEVVSSVGGSMGMGLYQAQQQYNNTMANLSIQNRQLDLSEGYNTRLWGVQDKLRNLGYAQQEWNFDFQGRQLDLSRQQWGENFSMNMRSTNLQRGWERQDWSLQDMQRDRAWGWKVEDFNEESRFMTGRQRKLAERQMGRETILHNEDEDRVKKERDRKKELWRLEDQRFEIQRKHFNESAKMQDEQLEKSREFYEQRKKLEEEQVRIQRQYQKEQMQLQRESAKIAAGYAAENLKLQRTMAQLEIATRLTQAQLSTVADDGFSNLREALLDINPELERMIDQLLRVSGGSGSGGGSGGGSGDDSGGGSGCFVAGTPVVVFDEDNNYQEIEIQNIRPGHIVLSMDTKTKGHVRAEVVEVFKHEASEISYLITLNGKIVVTPEHLMFVNGDWKGAGNIYLGDYLMDGTGKKVRVTSIETMPCNEPVYNLHTNHETHNYFVHGLLVHNAKTQTEFAEGGTPNPSMVSVAGEKGWEFLVGGKVISHDESKQLARMGLRPGASYIEAESKRNNAIKSSLELAEQMIAGSRINTDQSSFVSLRTKQNNQQQTINIYIGNEKLGSYTVSAVEKDLKI